MMGTGLTMSDMAWQPMSSPPMAVHTRVSGAEMCKVELAWRSISPASLRAAIRMERGTGLGRSGTLMRLTT